MGFGEDRMRRNGFLGGERAQWGAGGYLVGFWGKLRSVTLYRLCFWGVLPYLGLPVWGVLPYLGLPVWGDN